MPATDDFDPCAEYLDLRKAYLSILKGEGVVRVRFRNGDDERDTEFTRANIADLKAAMAEMQRECEAKNGRPRRMAIKIGRRGPGMRIY